MANTTNSTNNIQRTTRRQFIQTSAAAGMATGMGYVACRDAKAAKGANEKLNVGIVGCSGRGGHNMGKVSGENIVALCDVDSRHIARAKRGRDKAKEFRDFRKMLDDPSLNLDAVVVSTTDMTHAPAAVRAMRRNLHVYSEKPLAHTVGEARLMQDTYKERKKKIATQMGTQIHATDNYRRVVELCEQGAIGNIKEAHVWCNRRSNQKPVPTGEATPPSYLDWDLWTGPSPERPYQRGLMPGNLTWNRYWHYGNGIIGDMGSHLIDLPYWALGLTYPTSAHATSPKPNPMLYPDWLIVNWEHPKRGDGPNQQPCTVTWYDGAKKPSNLHGINVSKYGIGALFVGEKGMLLADYGKRTIYPTKGDPIKTPNPEKQTIKKSIGHHNEWLAACKGDPTATLCNFDYSGRLIEHNLLGVVSHRCGNKKIQWDAKALKATNAPEAERFINKTYRKGWGFDE